MTNAARTGGRSAEPTGRRALDPEAHVLIVEDDAAMRHLIARLLRENGFRATGVRDGREMRETLRNTSVELVLLDVMLPGQSPLATKRALGNLIDNAVKYGGGARVSLAEAPGEVVVRVEDDGPGIPDESLQAVFEPFHRLEESRNRGTGGTGLGLAIARQVVEAHGGCIRLANRREGGLVATVGLPRAGTLMSGGGKV